MIGKLLDYLLGKKFVRVSPNYNPLRDDGYIPNKPRWGIIIIICFFGGYGLFVAWRNYDRWQTAINNPIIEETAVVEPTATRGPDALSLSSGKGGAISQTLSETPRHTATPTPDSTQTATPTILPSHTPTGTPTPVVAVSATVTTAATVPTVPPTVVGTPTPPPIIRVVTQPAQVVRVVVTQLVPVEVTRLAPTQPPIRIMMPYTIPVVVEVPFTTVVTVTTFITLYGTPVPTATTPIDFTRAYTLYLSLVMKP
jgi:hypothetical protein